MLHTVDELNKKIEAMRDLALLAHREKYKVAEGGEYNIDLVTRYVEQIQSLAGDIYNDKSMHPKLKAKQEALAWKEYNEGDL
jgi:hypothetical protein